MHTDFAKLSGSVVSSLSLASLIKYLSMVVDCGRCGVPSESRVKT